MNTIPVLLKVTASEELEKAIAKELAQKDEEEENAIEQPDNQDDTTSC